MTPISVENHLLYALHSAEKKTWPFPHFFAKEVFPRHFYAEMLDILAKKDDFKASEFGNRTFATENVLPGLEFMMGTQFLKDILALWPEEMRKRFIGDKISLSRDLRLVRDHEQYKIGPHTDAIWKVVSLLFYLPDAFCYEGCGTSIYLPKDRKFTCEGGPHYPFEPFDKLWTAPYIPNSCFGFWKTNNSFHGVEPLSVQFNRDVLLYNIYAKIDAP